jgi:hypothetical protein
MLNQWSDGAAHTQERDRDGSLREELINPCSMAAAEGDVHFWWAHGYHRERLPWIFNPVLDDKSLTELPLWLYCPQPSFTQFQEKRFSVLLSFKQTFIVQLQCASYCSRHWRETHKQNRVLTLADGLLKETESNQVMPIVHLYILKG